MSEVLIYTYNVASVRLQGWAEKILGQLCLVYGEEGADTMIYHADAEGKSGLVLTMGFGGGAYTEVTLTSETLPWRYDYECARQAARDFSTEVICDPGPLCRSGPQNPYEWLRVTPASEKLISWGTDEEG